MALAYEKKLVGRGEPTLCAPHVPLRRFLTIKQQSKFRINNIIFSLFITILNFLLQLYLILTLFSNLLSDSFMYFLFYLQLAFL